MSRQVPEGAKVKFGHGRRVDGDNGNWYRTKGQRGDLHSWVEEGRTLSPRGGRTSCTVILPDGSEYIGVAECSVRDNYSKRIGRDIALGRALKNLEQAKGEA